jgi:hypothetical protein
MATIGQGNADVMVDMWRHMLQSNAYIWPEILPEWCVMIPINRNYPEVITFGKAVPGLAEAGAVHVMNNIQKLVAKSLAIPPSMIIGDSSK